MTTERRLQLMPREERAKVQGMSHIFALNGFAVKRLTLRYWWVNGNKMLRSDAARFIGEVEDET